jgi:hypothetical protein
MSDPFWFDDFRILYDKDRLIEFFPLQSHTFNEKLNAIVRCAIYISVLIYIVHKDASYFSYAAVVIVFTIFLQKSHNQSELLENTDGGQSCTKPTLDNPFMNFTMGDRLNIVDSEVKDKPPACDPESVKKDIEKNFENNLYRDVNDVFGKINSQRQFYTMPWTSAIPDPNGDFKNWLYKSPKTCKEDSDFCNRYEDIRRNTPVFVNPDINPVK